MTGPDRGQTNLDFVFGVSIFLITVIFVFSFVPGMLEPFTASTQRETAVSDRIADQLTQDMLVSDPAKPYRLDRECTVIFFESRTDSSEDQAGDDAENIDGDGDFSEPFGTGTYSGSCNFEDGSLGERLGTTASSGSSLHVHVRLVRNLTTGEADNPDHDSNDVDDGDPFNGDGPQSLCVDANSDHRIVESDGAFDSGDECDVISGDDDVTFQIGPTPPDGTGSVVVARRFVHVEGGFADGTSDAMLVVEVW